MDMSYQKISMLPREQLLELIKMTPFSALEDADISKLAGLSEFCIVRAGECIRSDADSVSALFIIISGKVGLHTVQEERLTELGEGECFGMLSLIFPGLSCPMAYAMEDTAFIMLDSVAYRMIGLSDPKLAVSLLRCIQSAVNPLLLKASKVISQVCS